jgi:hypothetical protein
MVKRPTLNYPPRSDGGPYFIFNKGTNRHGNACVEVFFTDVPQRKRRNNFKQGKLLEVSKQTLKIYPLIIREDRDDYLMPAYDPIACFIFDNKACTVPKDEIELEAVLVHLPSGFGKDLRFGLLIPFEYRFILWGIKKLSENTTSIRFLDSYNESNQIKGSQYRMTLDTFDEMRRKLDRITERHNSRAMEEKEGFVSKVLRDGIDPSKYQYQPPVVRKNQIANLTQDGKVAPAKLTKRDKNAVVKVIEGNVDELVKDRPTEMMRLSAEIELVNLRQLIERFEEMLGKNLSEEAWQTFFNDNPFILSLAFSTPTIYVQENVYVGGTRMTREGAKLADFLYKSASTGNLAIIEIKKPNIQLLGGVYRDEVFPPHQQLSGAVIQVMDQRSKLHRKFDGLKADGEDQDIQASAIQCAVVVGRTPEAKAERHSFDLYRYSLTSVTVLTFDELLGKLKEIEGVLGESRTSGNRDGGS